MTSELKHALKAGTKPATNGIQHASLHCLVLRDILQVAESKTGLQFYYYNNQSILIYTDVLLYTNTYKESVKLELKQITVVCCVPVCSFIQINNYTGNNNNTEFCF